MFLANIFENSCLFLQVFNSTLSDYTLKNKIQVSMLFSVTRIQCKQVFQCVTFPKNRLMHVIYANLKVGSLPTSSCIFDGSCDFMRNMQCALILHSISTGDVCLSGLVSLPSCLSAYNLSSVWTRPKIRLENNSHLGKYCDSKPNVTKTVMESQRIIAVTQWAH